MSDYGPSDTEFAVFLLILVLFGVGLGVAGTKFCERYHVRIERR